MRGILLLLVLGASAGRCRAENLASLVTDARVLVFDAASASRQRYNDNTITQLINVGQRQAVAVSQCLEASIQFQLQQGVTYYTLPSDYLTIERVTLAGLWIQELSPAALDGRSRGWEVSSGYPTYYFVNWSSPTLIGFAPFPQVYTDTAAVKVEYTQNAADLVSSSDVPFNGVAKYSDYDHALAYFAASIIMTSYGKTAQASSYMAVYSAAVTAMQNLCRLRRNYMPSASGAQ